MKKFALVFVVVFLSFFTSPVFAQASASAMTNANVIELQGLGLGDDVIMGKIKASKCNFDTSIEALKALKAANVSNAVITAMVEKSQATAANDPNDPATPHDAGIYLMNEVNGERTLTMLKYALVSVKYKGLWSQHAIIILSEGSSKLIVTTKRPVFYFYFGAASEAQKEVSGMFTSATPESFSVVPLQKDGNTRQFELNFLTNSQGKILVDFEFEKVGPATFKATPKSDLPDGEYCIANFFQNSHNVLVLKNGSYIYDFAVKTAK